MAKKSLEEMLQKNTARPDALETARRQALFLGLWDEICEAYSKGWSYIEIWRTLHREGVVDFNYSTFMHFMKKMRRRQLEAQRGNEANRKTASANPGPPVPTTPTFSPPSPGITPGSTRVDMPRFGEGLQPRDPKKF